jgi:TetR/AcrR family transcriptional regulator, regulator of autoinduction and epiphytic fitness
MIGPVAVRATARAKAHAHVRRQNRVRLFRRERGLSVQDYRQRVSARKRNAILDAAVEVFLRDGYERASMDEIARRASVSTATLYKHASGKSQLFGSILARAWDVGDAAADESLRARLNGSPRQALLAIGEHYARSLTNPKVVQLFRAVMAEFHRFPELGGDLYSRAKLPYLQRIERYLEECHASGRLVVHDPKGATRQLLGMINDQVFWPGFLVPSFKVSAAQARRVVAEAVETLLARVSPDRH